MPIGMYVHCPHICYYIYTRICQQPHHTGKLHAYRKYQPMNMSENRSKRSKNDGLQTSNFKRENIESEILTNKQEAPSSAHS